MNNYEYIKDYMKKNCMHFGFTLNKNTDADVVEYLEKLENKRGYMLDLIREDMKKRVKKGEIKLKSLSSGKDNKEKAAKKTAGTAKKAAPVKAKSKNAKAKNAAVKKTSAKKAVAKKSTAKKSTAKKTAKKK